METKNRLHLGCGRAILDGFVNVDQAKLPGVEVVHSLQTFPWPFEDQQFEQVIMVDVLEHLSDVIRTMEEIHRITKVGARVTLRVPYYNSWDASHDPTHQHIFNENSFDFFDVTLPTGALRAYYTSAKFRIDTIGYLIYLNGRALLVCDSNIDPLRVKLPSIYDKRILRSTLLKRIYTKLGHKVGNTIRTLHVELMRE